MLKLIVTFHFSQDSDDLPSRDDVSHRAVFGDDVDEDELLAEIESEKNRRDSGPTSDDDDDSEGPDQVDSDEPLDLLETEAGN